MVKTNMKRIYQERYNSSSSKTIMSSYRDVLLFLQPVD